MLILSSFLNIQLHHLWTKLVLFYLAQYVHLLIPIHGCIMHNYLELPVWCWKGEGMSFLAPDHQVSHIKYGVGVGFLLISLVKLRRMFMVFILDGCCCAMLRHFGRVRLFAALQTAARRAPLSMGFSRQEYWSGLPCWILSNALRFCICWYNHVIFLI